MEFFNLGFCADAGFWPWTTATVQNEPTVLECALFMNRTIHCGESIRTTNTQFRKPKGNGYLRSISLLIALSKISLVQTQKLNILTKTQQTVPGTKYTAATNLKDPRQVLEKTRDLLLQPALTSGLAQPVLF